VVEEPFYMVNGAAIEVVVGKRLQTTYINNRNHTNLRDPMSLDCLKIMGLREFDVFCVVHYVQVKKTYLNPKKNKKLGSVYTNNIILIRVNFDFKIFKFFKY
jgi:hypothetical protein